MSAKGVLDLLHEEYDQYQNTLVIDYHFGVVLFLGILERPDDFYYMLMKNQTNTVYLASCVGRIIPLKDRLFQKDYDNLADVWNHNNEMKAS
jgi:alpha/beta superfamily hydrolase